MIDVTKIQKKAELANLFGFLISKIKRKRLRFVSSLVISEPCVPDH